MATSNPKAWKLYRTVSQWGRRHRRLIEAIRRRPARNTPRSLDVWKLQSEVCQHLTQSAIHSLKCSTIVNRDESERLKKLYLWHFKPPKPPERLTGLSRKHITSVRDGGLTGVLRRVLCLVLTLCLLRCPRLKLVRTQRSKWRNAALLLLYAVRIDGCFTTCSSIQNLFATVNALYAMKRRSRSGFYLFVFLKR